MNIGAVWRFIEETCFGTKKKVITSVVVTTLVLSMPVTLVLLNQQQDIRQRAASVTSSCPASTLQSLNANQQQIACNSGASFYTVTFTCGDGFTSSKQYQCGINNSGNYTSDGTAMCAARQYLCLPPTPTPTPIGGIQPPVGITPVAVTCPAPATAQSVGAASTNTVDVTFDMKSPIYAKADGPISSVTYKSGNWCAWSPTDTINYPRCPLPCPGSPTSGYPWTISQDKLSFYSDFDRPYPDNSGSCTYSIACTSSVIAPTPTPTIVVTPTPTCGVNGCGTSGPSPSPSPNPSICTTPPECPAIIAPIGCTLSGGSSCSCPQLVCVSPSPSVSPVVSPGVTPSGPPTPTPTIAPLPSEPPVTITPSTTPGATIGLDITLPGIGPNTTLGENNSPLHNTREFNVYAFDNSGKEVAKTTANLTYNNGDYVGLASFGNIPNGPYTVKIRTGNSLVKIIPGIYELSMQNVASTPKTMLVTGDIKTDGDSNNLLDLLDYNALLSTFSSTTNLAADLNDDGTVDAKDLNILLRGFATRQGD